jgi:hypothetical protein
MACMSAMIRFGMSSLGARCVGQAAGRLLFGLDDVPPDSLGCLVTLRREVRPGF